MYLPLAFSDLPWQRHVEWSLHWLSLLVTSCGGSLGPHQPYKGCVKKENCMVYVLTVTVVERWKPLWISLCLLCNRGWVCSLSWSSEARAQTRSRKVKDGEGWIEQEKCEEQWPLNGDCISLLFRSSDMAEERAIYSLLSSHSEIVSMRCRSPFLWFFCVLFVGLIQRCTVVFLTSCVSRLKRAELWYLPRKIFDKTVRLGKQVLLEVFTLT